MEQPDTDVKIDNSSLEESVTSKGPTCGKDSSSSLITSTTKENSNVTSYQKTSHVSPLEIFERRFSIGGRSKSMSESLPFTPRNEKIKFKGNDGNSANYDTGRKCRTPKRLQHQRNVKVDDDVIYVFCAIGVHI